MSGAIFHRPAYALAAALVLTMAIIAGVAPVAAEGLEAGAATWRLEQPRPPKPPPGVEESSVPIALGTIGDIEFFAPNRGLLITAGNPPTIPPGVWAYDGVEWHELATVCGATDGRIAWAGPEEFWTVSDGRPGQAAEAGRLEQAPLQDNTLCHFSAGRVVGSYAHPAFRTDSYQAMHAAACIGPNDCWFAGNTLPEPGIGAFQLHWNGGSLEAEPYPEEGHAVEDMRLLEEHLYESVRLESGDRVTTPRAEPPVVHRINPDGVTPAFESELELPLYGSKEIPEALDFLNLSAADGILWGAAGAKRASAGEPGQLTVVRRAAGNWSQLVGAAHPLGGGLFPEEAELLPEGAMSAAVRSIAAEPATNSAWVALAAREQRNPTARAALLHISAEGKVIETQSLPSARERSEGTGGKGSAAKLACPAPHDCWLATTQGWLYHLAPEKERTLARDTDPAFAALIADRPHDQGLPQVPADAPPPDTSGLVEAPPNYGGAFAEAKPQVEATVKAPLLTHIRSRLVHGTTLELRFHLAVKARVRLLAKRRKAVIASTRTYTFDAGDRKLLLRLDRRRWPNKLALDTHPLAPLPTEPSRSSNVGTISTGLFVLPRGTLFGGSGRLP